MQLSKFTIAVIVAALGFASASPTPEAMVEDAPEARDIEYLNHAGWAWQHSNKGGTRWSLTDMGNCYSLLASSQNDKYSSMEIFDGYECKFYKNYFCDKNMWFGQSGEVKRRGPWSGNVPSGWHDVISGYNCYKV